jgi:hypothetical protein
MANMLFANNASSTLAAGISISATTLTVAAGTGSLFPQPGSGQYFYCTLQSAIANSIEIIKVTGRSGDTFTVTRGQDNTSASAFASGDKVELRLVAANLNDLPKLDEDNVFTRKITATNISTTSLNFEPYSSLYDGGNGNIVVASSSGTSVNAVFEFGPTYNLSFTPLCIGGTIPASYYPVVAAGYVHGDNNEVAFGVHSATGTLPLGVATTGGTSHGLMTFYHDDGSSLKILCQISSLGTTDGAGIHMQACTVSAPSDRRLKTNISTLTNSGSIIDAIQPRTYTYTINNTSSSGFIADELQAVLPNSVFTPEPSKEDPFAYQSVNYGSSELIATMVAELQSLRKRVATLEENQKP